MNRTMNRTTMLALLMMAVVLLLASGVVLAKDFSCDPTTERPCVGTKKGDNIIGTAGDDEINGCGGNDTIAGDSFISSGDDLIRGGGSNDDIADFSLGNDIDTIFGDKGDDTINVRGGASYSDNPDVVDCGPGIDTVFVDPTDTRHNCEILNPQD
jgi:Ca2+-binding RTX toxin-like protein